MAGLQKTLIFCFDDHRNYSEDVRKRFSDTSRYLVKVSHNRDEFLKQLNDVKDDTECKVALIGVHDTKENYEIAEHLITDIKRKDISTGIIVLAPPDKIEDVRKTIRINVDSYIPRNGNMVLRVHNTIKKLISQHSLSKFRRRRNFSFYVLISALILSILFALLAWLKLPQYF